MAISRKKKAVQIYIDKEIYEHVLQIVEATKKAHPTYNASVSNVIQSLVVCGMQYLNSVNNEKKEGK